jgi:hypothetical protein
MDDDAVFARHSLVELSLALERAAQAARGRGRVRMSQLLLDRRSEIASLPRREDGPIGEGCITRACASLEAWHRLETF